MAVFWCLLLYILNQICTPYQPKFRYQNLYRDEKMGIGTSLLINPLLMSGLEQGEEGLMKRQ